MLKAEFLADQGLRLDGRRFDELRNIECRLSVFSQTDGSSYLEWGNTKVLAAVYGPHETRLASQRLADRALINCQYSQAVFSQSERKHRPRGDRRALEFTRQLREALQSVVIDTLYPRSQIDVYVEVLQADGGRECACINAAVLALMDAGVAIRDQMSACTAAMSASRGDADVPMVDLSRVEESGTSGGRLIGAVLPRGEGLLPMLGLTHRLHVDRLPTLIESVNVAARRVHGVLSRAVKCHVATGYALTDLGVNDVIIEESGSHPPSGT